MQHVRNRPGACVCRGSDGVGGVGGVGALDIHHISHACSCASLRLCGI